MNKIKLIKNSIFLILVFISYNFLGFDTINVKAEDGDSCTVTSCSGSYENGFCSICDGYQPAIKTVGKYEYDPNKDGIYDEDVYEIYNAGQLYWFEDKVNNENDTYGSINAILMENIVVPTSVSNGGVIPDWNPIGYFNIDDPDNPFLYAYSGVFDGNGKTISGIYMNSTNYFGFIGLFGIVNNATVKNLGVINSSFSGSDSSYVAAVVGCSISSTIENCYNKDTTVTGYFVGGIVAFSESSTIKKCYNEGIVNSIGNIDNGCAGGVVGYSVSDIIDECYNVVAVNGVYRVGGILGCISNSTTVNNCYNIGDITGTGENIGGIVGYNSYEGIITNCFNIGKISGSFSGEIVGNSLSGIENCYHLAESDDESSGKTVSQFESGEVAYLLGSAWGQNLTGENKDEYPVLRTDNNAIYYGYISCAEDAVIVYTNDSSASEVKPEHNIIKATCTSVEGCSKCDYTTGVEIDEESHPYDEGVITTNPTCTEKGIILYTCTHNSLHTYTEEISEIGHNYGTTSYTWNDDYTACIAETICLNDSNHKETESGTITTETIKSTCIEDGKIIYKAEFINTFFFIQNYEITITSNGHNYDESNWGYKDSNGHAHLCTECGEYDEIISHISSGQATEDIEELCTECEYVITPKLIHNHNASCKLEYDDTYHWYDCVTNDGEEYEKYAHSYGEWNVTKEATETEKGSKEKTCDCGHKVIEEIPSLENDVNSDESLDLVPEPSIDNEGLSGGAIAGIVIGIIALICGLVIGWYILKIKIF